MLKALVHPARAAGLLGTLAFKKNFSGYCPVCGSDSSFKREGLLNLRETFICCMCGSVSRTRHVAVALCETLRIAPPYSVRKIVERYPGLSIYEPQTYGPIHERLTALKGYVCSEFGARAEKRDCRREDLQSLSFEDNSFDIIITQDIMEHVARPELAWEEIYRVLKPSGIHVFSIPYSDEKDTQIRQVEVGGKQIMLKDPDFHLDGNTVARVYTDFGRDIIGLLDRYGFSTERFSGNGVYEKKYRIYWSHVFVSRKPR